jgi:8-oxo-dGTP pyrophosphatase MutT (NUDIX family)
VTTLPFDPYHAQLESIAGEAAIEPVRLSVDWIRRRFASPPAWNPEKVIEPRLKPAVPLVPAAVLIPLVAHASGLTVLLTQRAAHLANHGGQVSFPGGRAETDDASRIDTALREAEEEIGLQRGHVSIVGTLPEYVTGTGYCVAPVVGILLPPFDLRADPLEVAEIFEVPLAFLMNGMHHERRSIALPDGLGQRTFYAMPYNRFLIWGATAGMLRNLYHFLRA